MEYRYRGEERVYVDRAIVVNDGDLVDWETPPADGHWEPAPAVVRTETASTSSAPAANTSKE